MAGRIPVFRQLTQSGLSGEPGGISQIPDGSTTGDLRMSSDRRTPPIWRLRFALTPFNLADRSTNTAHRVGRRQTRHTPWYPTGVFPKLQEIWKCHHLCFRHCRMAVGINGRGYTPFRTMDRYPVLEGADSGLEQAGSRGILRTCCPWTVRGHPARRADSAKWAQSVWPPVGRDALEDRRDYPNYPRPPTLPPPGPRRRPSRNQVSYQYQ
jgi:hypothetical protein